MEFKLNEKQQKRFEQWRDAFYSKFTEEELDEDCCMSSPFTFHFRDMGITTSVYVTVGKERLDLTLDDEGEFIRS